MNDYDLEKKYHPENFEEDDKEEASDLIAIIQDALDDLDKYSAYHDDIFNSEVYEIGELIKRMRQQL